MYNYKLKISIIYGIRQYSQRKGIKMLEILAILLVMLTFILYIYSQEKIDQNGKIPFDKSI